MNETQALVANIKKATSPEQLFGATHDHSSLKLVFRSLAKLVHPDTFDPSSGVPKAEAEEAFKRLNNFEAIAGKRITANIYGDLAALLEPIIVKTKKEEYTLTRKLPPTGIANIYRGTNKAGEMVLLKVARLESDNDLIQNETEVLRKIRNDSETMALNSLQQIPRVLNSFVNISGKTKQGVVVFEYSNEVQYTLAEVKAAYPSGVPLEHAAWMFNRIMTSLEAPHLLNIVHGAILPENIVIHPRTHNGILTNWDFAVSVGKPLNGIMTGGNNRQFYPFEIFDKKPIDLGLDLFMAAKLFIYISGGSVNSNTFPATWEKIDTKSAKEGYRKIKGLMASCLLVQGHRSTNVASLYIDFRAALELIFGPPKWREFTMP